MKGVVCLVILSLVSAAVAANKDKPLEPLSSCTCKPEEKQEDHNSRLRIAWLLLQDYKTKLYINKLEKQLGLNQTTFTYEELAQDDLSVLTTAKQPDCACGRNLERERKNTYLRTAYLTLYSYKAELEIIKLQKELGLPQSDFELDKFIWPENVVTSTAASTRVRRQAKCSNGCILFCNRYGGVRYNKDGSCTSGYKCQCIKSTFP